MGMDGVNIYGRQLSQADIEQGVHRELIGGMWDELGQLQFEFMKDRGLMPHHRLVDVGCGSLRGGVHFVDYLDSGYYHGLDINASLIIAGKKELDQKGLLRKQPNLLIDDQFTLSKFNSAFDYGIAVSVFTHLYSNHIVRCLVEVCKTLRPNGVFFATFFESPTSAHVAPITHQPGSVTTYLDQDPFHYSYEEFEWMAQTSGLSVERIGDWRHPRNQKMLAFSLPPHTASD